MGTVQKFEELEVWQLARTLAKDVYNLTKNTGFSKQLYLKDQMNRSAGSVMDNIAEGYGRGSRLEFVQFLSIAAGSVEELKSQLYRSLDFQFIRQDEFDQLYNNANLAFKKINSFMKYLNTTSVQGTKFKERTEAKNRKP